MAKHLGDLQCLDTAYSNCYRLGTRQEFLNVNDSLIDYSYIKNMN